MTPHVLVIGDGGDVAPALRDVHGARTTTLCRVSALARVIDARDNFRLLSADGDVEEWRAIARLIHCADPFTALGAYTELDQDRAAVIAEDLGLSFHKPAVVAAVYDKYLMRRKVFARGVEDTPCRRIVSPQEASGFGREVGYPLILKPAAGFASHGIALARGPAELDDAFGRAAGVAGLPGAVLIERFHTGREFSVEAFSHAGEHHVIAVTEKFSTPESFVEVGHIIPALLSVESRREIEHCVRRVLDALEVASGATHTELVLTDAGARLVETHTRMAGDEIPDLVREVCGIDIARLSAAETLGLGTSVRVSDPGGGVGAVWYFAPPAAGRITRVGGIGEIRALAGVVAVDVKKGPGEYFGGWPLASSMARAVSVRVHARNRDEVLRLRERIASLLTFRTTADVESAPAGQGTPSRVR